MRRQRQHQRRFHLVGMAAMALLGQLPGHAGIARTFVDPQMLDALAREARQGAVDRGQRADPGVEHEQLLQPLESICPATSRTSASKVEIDRLLLPAYSTKAG